MEFFCQINEEPFVVLYYTKHSQPEVPENVLIGLEAQDDCIVNNNAPLNSDKRSLVKIN